jgi:hypothetical protein
MTTRTHITASTPESDVSVTSCDVSPPNPVPGQKVTLAITITNNTSKIAVAELRLYRKSPGEVDWREVGGSRITGGIQPGDNVRKEQIPNALETVGEYKFKAELGRTELR